MERKIPPHVYDHSSAGRPSDCHAAHAQPLPTHGRPALDPKTRAELEHIRQQLAQQHQEA
jgi:hypothetical protein